MYFLLLFGIEAGRRTYSFYLYHQQQHHHHQHRIDITFFMTRDGVDSWWTLSRFAFHFIVSVLVFFSRFYFFTFLFCFCKSEIDFHFYWNFIVVLINSLIHLTTPREFWQCSQFLGTACECSSSYPKFSIFGWMKF